MRSSDEPVRAASALQASEWYFLNREGQPGTADAPEFMAWLRASPLHVEEYLAIATLARDLTSACAAEPASAQELIAAARAETASIASIGARRERTTAAAGALRRSAAPRRAAIALSAAASLLVAVSALLDRGGERARSAPQSYATAHGEQRALSLPDGTLLRLNTDSQVVIRYSREERLVTVERGEALFEVAHEAARRFRVEAGSAGAIAIGTQFAVYRKPTGATVITVVEGAIGVFAGGPPAPSAGRALPSSTLRVHAGEQVTIPLGRPPSAPATVDVAQATAWLQRRIAFDARPLGEVVDEFNRFASVRFAVEDPATRALKISGVFDAYDSESFAVFLGTIDGVSVERNATRIRVAGRPPAR